MAKEKKGLLKAVGGFLWAVISFKWLRALFKRKKVDPYTDPLGIYPLAVQAVGEKPRSFVIEYDEEGGGLAYKIVFGQEPRLGRPPKQKKEESEEKKAED